ncbi:MAG: hypothetical protein AB7W16_24580 [Candidatus Obscuribacterales bacterium]
MKTILCNGCGEVMTRFMNKCRACTGTDLTFYESVDSPELKKRVKEIKGGVDPWTRAAAAALVAGIVLVIGFGVLQAGHVEKIKQAPIQTAASTQSITE